MCPHLLFEVFELGGDDLFEQHGRAPSLRVCLGDEVVELCGAGRGWCGRWPGGWREQALQVLGVLDGLSGVVGAAMADELGLLVEDADAGVAGEQGQGLANVGRRAR